MQISPIWTQATSSRKYDSRAKSPDGDPSISGDMFGGGSLVGSVFVNIIDCFW